MATSQRKLYGGLPRAKSSILNIFKFWRNATDRTQSSPRFVILLRKWCLNGNLITNDIIVARLIHVRPIPHVLLYFLRPRRVPYIFLLTHLFIYLFILPFVFHFFLFIHLCHANSKSYIYRDLKTNGLRTRLYAHVTAWWHYIQTSPFLVPDLTLWVSPVPVIHITIQAVPGGWGGAACW